MSNTINGDFNQEALDAFRSAYASRELEPEDLEVDPRTGLPSNVVLNTSPWVQHTGLWKANDGTDRNFVPNQVLIPGADTDEDSDELSDEELEMLLEELTQDESEDEGGEEDEDYDELLALRSLLEQENLDELTEDEVDSLIDEILKDNESEDLEYELDSEEEVGISDEEIDSIISELAEEFEVD